MTDEQWKDRGDCTQCRRSEYCHKSCTAKKAAVERAARFAAAQIFAQQYNRLHNEENRY